MPNDLLLEHAAAAARAFLTPDRRSRLLALLDGGNPKHWRKFESELAGSFSAHLDPRWARRLAPPEEHPAEVERLLRDAGAPDVCVVLRDGGSAGGEVPLGAALEYAVGSGCGVLVSCVPGVLAYHEAETCERYVLHRPADGRT
ncbi:hypothetical protein [Streptomyces sp. ODS28]|uniref:hypothetical protein n=1 Tax=Streptomyces sp. ODS28 TaxID=3136688 RepID=UPI0031EB2B57